MRHYHFHENLDVYKLAVKAARSIRGARWPHGEAQLKDQAKRAADSVVLNLAEGCYHQGKAKLNYFRIASGSAAEACAVLDLIPLAGGSEIQQELRRVTAMLRKLR